MTTPRLAVAGLVPGLGLVLDLAINDEVGDTIALRFLAPLRSATRGVRS